MLVLISSIFHIFSVNSQYTFLSADFVFGLKTNWCQRLKQYLSHYKVILATEEVITATAKLSQSLQK